MATTSRATLDPSASVPEGTVSQWRCWQKTRHGLIEEKNEDLNQLLIRLAGSGLMLSLAAAGIYSWRFDAGRRVTPTPIRMVTHARTSASDFQAGVALLVYPQDFDGGAYGRLLDRLVADRVNSLSIAFMVQMDGIHASRVRRGQFTPSNAYLADVVRQARARGFTVMLRPLIDQSNLQPQWRGVIEPASPTAWFASYDELVLSYAQLARRTGAQVLDIGSELGSMETYVSAWQNLIAQTRQVFPGQVTYSANWYPRFTTGFWPQLDFVSVDGYFPLGRAPVQATAEELAADWQPWIDEMKRADQPSGKPIVMTELGLVPRTGAQLKPWDPSVGRKFDLEQQRAYYQAACQAVKPAVAGAYFWLGTGPELPSDLTSADYSPIGRPAEKEMTRCYSTA